ncbi:MAG: glycosyltransferase family 2 protein [Prevotella sp.]|nr:glycosyltransferase family 2 protein [Prevotella sp.]
MRVSVIIPVYNVSDYVERCVRSVMAQRYSDIECIIVDDCTPDDSITKCERQIAAYDGPISFSIVRHEKNKGVSAARNTGMKAATGDYVVYMDSDDAITDDCIEKLIRPIKRDASIEMVIGNHMRDVDGHRTYRQQQERELGSRDAIRDFFFCQRGFFVTPCNRLVKRDFLIQNELYFTEGLLWEDNLWTFYLLKHLSHLYIIPDATYVYYCRPCSITTGTASDKKARHWQLVYGDIARHFTEGESGKEARYFIKYICLQLIRIQRGQDIYQISRPYLKALRRDHYCKEYIVYSIIVFMTRFGFGRSLLSCAVQKMLNRRS